MLSKTAHFITRHPKLIVTFAVVLLAASLVGMAATRINYDILSYLPPDMDSPKGEKILEDPFQMAATTMLIVEGMPEAYTNQLRQSIEQVDHVSSALWVSSLVGIQIPTNMIPEEIRDVFYSGDSTMLIVQYDTPGASDETMKAIDEVRALCSKSCFLAGFSVVIRDTRALVDQEMPLYILLAVLLSYVAMSLTMESWLLPLTFLMNIGLAIAYNMGTNIFLGEISYITKAIAAILQLGVSMDYSIFLYHRYKEECTRFDDKRDAMEAAIQAAFTSLSGSSLTTIAGFLALCFMQLLLGRDIGVVMAKGVVLAVASVVVILPALLLQLDGVIERYKHPCLHLDFDRLNRFALRHKALFAVIFLLLFIPAVYGQTHAEAYYQLDRSLPQDMDSIVANDKLKEDYNMATSHFILLRDDLSSTEVNELTGQIEDLDGITTVLAYQSLMPKGVPDFFVPEDLREIFKQGGWQMIMANSSYATATDEVAQQLKQLTSIVKSYDPGAYITGEAAMTEDLIVTADVDFRVTNYISILAILLIICITFRSATVPVLLVAVIELAIEINEGIPYFTGTVIPFIAPTVVGCIQLGATVDYAILMTSRFREELQKGRERDEAIRIAASSSDISIITSSLVMFCATMGVAFVSKIEIISSICLLLARGAIISALVSLFILPSLLALCEPLIAKTSLYWRNAPEARKRKKRQSEDSGKEEQQPALSGRNH
ncbi:MAG: MMPL family transporter [Oscillospiraceae bacterium]|nr:MMPL family transporter [Oscillospiraceae bacterium]MDY4191281.1 MMPL family transporter [Oscillospiraceae bacterium]